MCKGYPYWRLSVLAVVLAAGGGACGTHGSLPAEDPKPDTISVGYGRQAGGEVTGAVSSASATQLDTRGVSRMDQLLERLPGVQIVWAGAHYTVRIRGARTGFSTGNPLLVLDDTPVPASDFSAVLEGIAPSEVASIDVLRDAGSSAIYGVRGANGVIIIKTKRGD